VARFGYTAMPAVYDVLVTPAMRAFGLSRDEVPAHEGNVFDPVESGDAVHGRWGRHWLRGVGAGALVAAGSVAATAARRVRR
jgi:hypothetical protein